MSAEGLRRVLIGLLAIAAVVSVVANKTHDRWLGAVVFAVFLVTVLAFAQWRRRARAERSARVFDREAKTDETGPRPDR